MPINDPQALAVPLREACIAWLDAGDGAFWIVSGVRTYDEQVALWNAYLNGTGNLAARPGTSRHERGLAVDIGGDKPLATRLAPTFGLGLTVPGEDWHFEVVDVAVASTYPKEDDIVTEEQMERLERVAQNQGRLTRKLIAAIADREKSRDKRTTAEILDAIEAEA